MENLEVLVVEAFNETEMKTFIDFERRPIAVSIGLNLEFYAYNEGDSTIIVRNKY